MSKNTRYNLSCWRLDLGLLSLCWCGVHPFHRCSLCFGGEVVDPCFIPLMIHHRNSLPVQQKFSKSFLFPSFVTNDMGNYSKPLHRIHCKNVSDSWKHCPLWTLVSRCGTHLWHSVPNPRCLWTMENTLPYKMFSMLAVSCNVMRRFSLMISSTWSTFATVLDVVGLPARYSSMRSVRPVSNCLHHFTIPGQEIARSPYTAVISQWMSV